MSKLFEIFNQPDEFGGAFAPNKKKNIMRTKTLKIKCFLLVISISCKRLGDKFHPVAGVWHKLPLPHKILLVLSSQRNYFSKHRVNVKDNWSHLFTGNNVVHCVGIMCQGQGKDILGGIAKLSVLPTNN